MCDACAPNFDRRTILRGVVLGGSMAAAGNLLAPRAARATPAPDTDTSNGGVESASMAEDAMLLTAHARTSTKMANATRQIPAPNANALQAPPIVSRKQWGANESIRLDNRSFAPIRKLIVHHTASPNKPSNPASVVRFVEAYHASGRGFSDTGYNYLIDHKGVIYEGRAARRYAANEVITGEDSKGWGVVGAHAKGFNAGSCGVCLIGDFDLASPTDAAIGSLVWLLAWKASRHRIDAKGAEEYIDIFGGRHMFANISGHRQVGQTLCPGSRLAKLLPAVRSEVARRAGTWPDMVVDNPGVLRREFGTLRSPSSGAALTTDSAATPATDSGATSTTAGNGASSGGDDATPGTGTSLSGIRVVSSAGTVYTAGAARALGNPATRGMTDVVSLTNAPVGDGYWVLGRNGAIAGFGGVPVPGDVQGKGAPADIAATPTAKGYWVLMADGGIFPFGDAGYASSPRRAGLTGTAQRIVPRPQADGYWVLMGGGAIRAFGAAPQLGSPTDAGTVVDLAATPSGGGYWVLTDAGRVVPFGDAVDKGDLKRSKVHWSKPVAHLLGTPSGKGYVIVNVEGAMLAFGDAPAYASFGGSGITATGVAPAFS